MALTSYLDSWTLSLDSANKSPKTIRSYTDTVRLLARFKGTPAEPADVTADHIRAFLVAERQRTSAASAQLHFRNLRVFFGWLERERDIDASPMRLVEKPAVPEEDKAFFSEDELRRLLKATSGQDFESRRDHALIRIMIDCGVRVGGLAGLRYDVEREDMNDVFLASRRLRVRLKGGDIIYVPVGKKTAYAIDRYLKERRRHPAASSEWMWLGTRGRGVTHFTDSGIRAMLRRRGAEAGVQDCHPHRFRHTFADGFLASGASVDDLMYVAGWRSYSMPMKYARGRGRSRAAEAHARLSPGDRL